MILFSLTLSIHHSRPGPNAAKQTLEIVSFYIETSLLIPKTPASIQRQKDIHERIRSLYFAGTPLFTKEQLSDAGQQLKVLKGESGIVKIIGLTGHVGEFSVNTGDILTSKKGKQRIIGTPRLSFRSIQDLTSFIGSNLYAPSIASCSLYIRQVSTPHVDPSGDGSSKALASAPDETETRQQFKTILTEWQSSKHCRDLVQALETTDLPDVRQVMAFACGSIAVQPGKQELARRSMYQHALLLTIRNFLNYKQHDVGPASTAALGQDPAYGSIDTAILAESDISLLENPDGFLRTDDSTLVLSFAPDVLVKQVITELARPAAIIWNKVPEHEDDEIGDGTHCPDADSPRVREMLSRQYRLIEFTFSEDLFSDVALYVRRREGD